MSDFFRACMDGARMDQAVSPISYEKLRVQSTEVDADEGGNVELASDVRDELEKAISQFFEVASPELIGPDSRPDLNVALNQCDGSGDLDCSQHFLEHLSFSDVRCRRA
jgi:hypothetical protein